MGGADTPTQYTWIHNWKPAAAAAAAAPAAASPAEATVVNTTTATAAAKMGASSSFFAMPIAPASAHGPTLLPQKMRR